MNRHIKGNLPFLLFFGLLLIQHSFVYLYHDDYGYASLSYLGVFYEDTSGHSYNLSQILYFLKDHYYSWGGRVLPFFIELGLLRYDIWVFRLAQVIVLTLTWFLLDKFLRKEMHLYNNKLMSGIILCSLYGLISFKFHQHGTYWASASVLYVWPFMWIFLAGALHYYLTNTQLNKPLIVFILGLLYFAAGFSQEQIFFPALFMLLGISLGHVFDTNKTPKQFWVDLICLLMLLLGYSLLIFAPGNAVRSSLSIYSDFYAMGLLDRARFNLPSLVSIIFGLHNFPILMVLVASNFLYLWFSPRVSGMIMRILCFVLMIAQLLYFLIFVVVLVGNTSQIEFLGPFVLWFNQHWSPSLILFWAVFISIACIIILLFGIRNHYYGLLGLFLGGFVSQLTMLFVPSTHFRVGLIFLFALFPILTAMLVSSLRLVKQDSLKKLVLVAIIVPALFNTTDIMIGYRENSVVLERNHNILEQASISIDQGTDIPAIVLGRLPDDQYAGVMAYQPGYDYVNIWIKRYYDLPPDVVLIWSE